MTTPASEPAASWPAGLVIRPPLDEGTGGLAEVLDTLSGRRFTVQAGELGKRIAAGGTAAVDAWLDDLAEHPDRRWRERQAAHLRSWWQRGWHPSAEYYLASRRSVYADLHDADGTARREGLGSYIRADGHPPRAELTGLSRRRRVQPAEPPVVGLAELLRHRRTVRAYDPRPVPEDVLSGLLWYGLARLRALAPYEREGRSDPLAYLSASSAIAFRFTVCAYGVSGLDPGIYLYDLETHELLSRRTGDHRERMCDLLQGMQAPRSAAWTISLVVEFPTLQWRYRHEHALRRLYCRAGFIGQELLVLGSAYGLGTLVTPAQKDTAFLELHRLDPVRFAPVYTLTMGWPRDKDNAVARDAR
jgi:nitroreductase